MGEEVLFAGYGLSESDDYAHLRATKNYLTEVTESQLVIEYDANNPDVGNSCYGDSGGPMTIKRDGYWALIGVVSSGNAINCALPGYETHDVSRWTNLTSDKNLQFIKNYTENILD